MIVVDTSVILAYMKRGEPLRAPVEDGAATIMAHP